MNTQSSGYEAFQTDVPRRAWYAIAEDTQVGRIPLARRILGEDVVLYRTLSGEVVALADRCLHLPVPLSLGRLDGDDIIAAYSGFRYGPDGRLVAVPTQQNVPFGARVRHFPVHEDGRTVWIWTGEPDVARLRPPPSMPWLSDPGWATVGDTWETEAGLAMWHHNFADIAHVPQVDPDIAPPILSGPLPPLHVEVTETTVSLQRDYPRSRLPIWQAQMTGVEVGSEHPQREQGQFLSPGAWVAQWRAWISGQGAADGEQHFYFTHILTPLDEGRTRHTWWVSRNFATDKAHDGTIRTLFERYYAQEQELLELMQRTQDSAPRQANVHVAADAAATQVRRILARLAEEERGLPNSAH